MLVCLSPPAKGELSPVHHSSASLTSQHKGCLWWPESCPSKLCLFDLTTQGLSLMSWVLSIIALPLWPPNTRVVIDVVFLNSNSNKQQLVWNVWSNTILTVCVCVCVCVCVPHYRTNDLYSEPFCFCVCLPWRHPDLLWVWTGACSACSQCSPETPGESASGLVVSWWTPPRSKPWLIGLTPPLGRGFSSSLGLPISTAVSSATENRLFVPANLRSQVLQWGHSSRLACHPGVRHTLALLRQSFWWGSMRRTLRSLSWPARFVPSTRVPAMLQ